MAQEQRLPRTGLIKTRFASTVLRQVGTERLEVHRKEKEILFGGGGGGRASNECPLKQQKKRPLSAVRPPFVVLSEK